MEVAILIILSFFAVYGMLQLLSKALFSSRAHCGLWPAHVHRVIGIKDCADSVEGMLRTLAWEDIREEMIVIDLGSRDETADILTRLEKEYDFLHVMTLQEYQAYLSDLISYDGSTT